MSVDRKRLNVLLNALYTTDGSREKIADAALARLDAYDREQAAKGVTEEIIEKAVNLFYGDCPQRGRGRALIRDTLRAVWPRAPMPAEVTEPMVEAACSKLLAWSFMSVANRQDAARSMRDALEAALAAAPRAEAPQPFDPDDLANIIYLDLIGSKAVPCDCGSGRICTSAYRRAVDAYAAAVKKLPRSPVPASAPQPADYEETLATADPEPSLAELADDLAKLADLVKNRFDLQHPAWLFFANADRFFRAFAERERRREGK